MTDTTRLTTALAASRLSVATRIALLDLRTESFLAQGNVVGADADIAIMLAVARRSGNPVLVIRLGEGLRRILMSFAILLNFPSSAFQRVDTILSSK